MAGGGPVEPVGPAALAGPADSRHGARGDLAADARLAVAGSTPSGGDSAPILRRVIAAPLGRELWQLSDGHRLQVHGADVRLRPGAVLRLMPDRSGRLMLTAIGPERLADPLEVHLLPPAARAPDDAVSLRSGRPVELAWATNRDEAGLPRHAVLRLDNAAARSMPTGSAGLVSVRAAVISVDTRGTLVELTLASGPHRALIPAARLPIGDTVILSWSAAATVEAGSPAEPSPEVGDARLPARAGGSPPGATGQGASGASPPAARVPEPAGFLRPGGAALGAGSTDVATGPVRVAGRPQRSDDTGGATRIAAGPSLAHRPPPAAIRAPSGGSATTMPSVPGSSVPAAVGPPLSSPGASPPGPPPAATDASGSVAARPGADAMTSGSAMPGTGGPPAGPVTPTPATAPAGPAELAAATGRDAADLPVEPRGSAGSDPSRTGVASRGGAGQAVRTVAAEEAPPPLGRELAPPGAPAAERREPPPAVLRDAEAAAPGRGETAATPRLPAEPGPSLVPPPPSPPERPRDTADDQSTAHEEGSPGQAPARRARFHLQLASLGAIDLAASCPDGRLDLVLRIERHLPAVVRREIEAIHAAALAASGRIGRLTVADGTAATGPGGPGASQHALDTVA